MFGKKKRVTIEELAQMLYYFARKFSVDYVSYEMNREESFFKNADRHIFEHERLMMIFWIIDRFFLEGTNGRYKIMAFIHRQYLIDLGVMNDLGEPIDKKRAGDELLLMDNRCREYNRVYDNTKSEQSLLGGVIAKNILQQDKIVTNFLIMSEVAIDVALLIKQLKESIFNKYEIRGGPLYDYNYEGERKFEDVCPHCNAELIFEEKDFIKDSISCPICHKKISFT